MADKRNKIKATGKTTSGKRAKKAAKKKPVAKKAVSSKKNTAAQGQTKPKAEVSEKKRCYSGKPLTQKERGFIATMYVMESSKDGILSRIRAEFIDAAKEDKGFREDISTATIAKVRDSMGLEKLRLENQDRIKEKYKDDGFDILNNNVELVRRMKGIIINRLVKQREYKISGSGEIVILDGVKPSFSELNTFVRLECFLKGGPDSRPDTKPPILTQVIIDGKSNDEIEAELQDDLALLNGTSKAPSRF